MFAGFTLPTGIVVIRDGYGWHLLGWLAFALFFLEVWGIHILRSPCHPYYVEKSLMLYWIANYSSLKLWRYHPEPMSSGEKIQPWLGFAILVAYPFPCIWGWGTVLLNFVGVHVVAVRQLLMPSQPCATRHSKPILAA